MTMNKCALKDSPAGQKRTRSSNPEDLEMELKSCRAAIKVYLAEACLRTAATTARRNPGRA